MEYCEELVIDIPSNLPHAEWQKYCIYRVPKQLRKVNEEAYTPKLVSIGPFHHIHSKDDLEDMEEHKLKYLDDFFLKRTKKSQVDLLKIIKCNEKEIRDSYSEDCGFESGDFVKMILLDAIFIIELFLKTKEQEKDYILSKPWLENGILHDLILLENQLPFLVLEELYMFAGCDVDQKLKFVELSRNYFSQYDKVPGSIIEKEIKVKHFTDLLRHLFCQYSSNEQEEESSCTRFWLSCPRKMELHWKKIMDKWRSKESSDNIRYCATKLDDAGLKFKGVIGGRHLLDIQPPQPGVLGSIPCFGRPMKIPQLKIDDYTETLLRNLMALEQCYYPFHTYICDYVYLMSDLIKTEQDVDLLVEKNVIVNCIGSNFEVATLISKLCIQILASESSYYSLLTQKVNGYRENTWNGMMASIKGTYFRDFGRSIATVGVLLALLGLFIPFLTK